MGAEATANESEEMVIDHGEGHIAISCLKKHMGAEATANESEEMVIDHGEGYIATKGVTYGARVSARVVEHTMAAYFLWNTFNFHWTWSALILGFLCGNLAADMISVVVHFTLDNYFTADTPFIGSTVHYFREHHAFPTRMVGKDFIDTNSEICVAGLVLCPLAYGIQQLGFLNSAIGNWTIGWTALLCTVINTVHCYTHMPIMRTPAWYRFFAITVPFFVHPEHHKTHHKNLNSHYSLYMGKMDLIFDFFYILETTEILVYMLLDVKPESGRAHRYISLKDNLSLSQRVDSVLRDLRNGLVPGTKKEEQKKSPSSSATTPSS